jgi:hypothetical protein
MMHRGNDAGSCSKAGCLHSFGVAFGEHTLSKVSGTALVTPEPPVLALTYTVLILGLDNSCRKYDTSSRFQLTVSLSLH